MQAMAGELLTLRATLERAANLDPRVLAAGMASVAPATVPPSAPSAPKLARGSATSNGRGSALAQAVRKQLGPIPSIALTAAVMGVTPKTIHNWIRKGSLRTTKPAGGKVYVDAESVIDFLERGRR